MTTTETLEPAATAKQEPGPGFASGARGVAVVTSSRVEAACWATESASTASMAVIDERSPEASREAIEEVCRQAPTGLVSFGVAAGLGPALRPGDLVIADRVVLPSGRSVLSDPDWREACRRRLADAGRKVIVAAAAGLDAPPSSVSGKRQVFRSTCAAVLDGISHLVAEAAEAEGLPLLALRAVADPSWDDHLAVPEAGIASLSLLAQFAARPLDMPSTWRSARNSRQALEALQSAAFEIPRPGSTVSA